MTDGLTEELHRAWQINGEDLAFKDVLRWAEKNPPEEVYFQGDEDKRALVGYLLHQAAVKLCGRSGTVVNQRTNSWSPDGSSADIEVTVGRPAPASTGAAWTDCQSYWFYQRGYQLDPAAKAFALYRKFRKAQRELYTERVEVAYAKPSGRGVDIRKFWIAYPPHIAAYADEDYRISHASGSGDTKTEALLSAATQG